MDVPTTKQRQMPIIQTVQRFMDVMEIQIMDRIVDVPTTKQHQTSMVQAVQRAAEFVSLWAMRRPSVSDPCYDIYI